MKNKNLNEQLKISVKLDSPVPYTLVKNEIIMNENISLEAKGLYCTILSYLNTGDCIDKKFLLEHCPDKKELEFAWNELVKLGLISENLINQQNRGQK